MTTYVLSLSGDEQKAANATHWARFRRARLIPVAQQRGERSAGRDSIVITGQGALDDPASRRAPCARDAGALAALLVRTLDIQDGTGVVLADVDSDEFAADVVARVAVLGREVTCTGQVSRFAFAASVLPRCARA
jgi:hypothetical protein